MVVSLTQPPRSKHLLSLADCLCISQELLNNLLLIIKCYKKQNLHNCLSKYGIIIPRVRVYGSPQSGVKTWICFGDIFPPQNPLEEINNKTTRPESIYTVIRQEALKTLPQSVDCQGLKKNAKFALKPKLTTPSNVIVMW